MSTAKPHCCPFEHINLCIAENNSFAGLQQVNLLVAGAAEDGAGLVADKALGDPSGPSRRARVRTGAGLLGDGLGAEHLNDERVARRGWPELVHFHEHWLPLRRRRSQLKPPAWLYKS